VDAGSCPAVACPCGQVCFSKKGICGVPRAIPAARYDATVVAIPGGAIYVAGGNGGGFALQDCWSYDPRSNDWTSLDDLPVAVAGAAGALSGDGRLWLVGGYDYADGGQAILSAAQVYDPAAVALGGAGWSLGPSVLTARAFAGLAVIPGATALMAFGGQASGGAVLDGVETYALDDGGWTAASLTLTRPREKFGSAAGDGIVFAAGGYDGHGSSALSDIEAFVDGGFTLWSQAMTVPRQGGGAAFDRASGRLYVIAGSADSPPGDLQGSAESCNVSGSPCALIAGALSIPRFGIGAALSGEVLFAFGGRTQSDAGALTVLSSVEAYTIGSACTHWASSTP